LKLRNAVDDNCFNPYTDDVQKHIEDQGIGPLVIFEDDKIKIQEFIYNQEMKRPDMLRQDYRLWIMMALADFLDNNVEPEKYFKKPN